MPGITDPSEEYFKDGVWGWDASQWQKLALLWGYTDVYAEAESNTNADAGGNYLTLSAVPTGEVWVVTLACARDVDNNWGATSIMMYLDSDEYIMLNEASGTAGFWKIWNGRLIVPPTGLVRVYIGGCTAGDDIQLSACGYKMAVS